MPLQCSAGIFERGRCSRGTRPQGDEPGTRGPRGANRANNSSHVDLGGTPATTAVPATCSTPGKPLAFGASTDLDARRGRRPSAVLALRSDRRNLARFKVGRREPAIEVGVSGLDGHGRRLVRVFGTGAGAGSVVVSPLVMSSLPGAGALDQLGTYSLLAAMIRSISAVRCAASAWHAALSTTSLPTFGRFEPRTNRFSSL